MSTVFQTDHLLLTALYYIIYHLPTSFYCALKGEWQIVYNFPTVTTDKGQVVFGMSSIFWHFDIACRSMLWLQYNEYKALVTLDWCNSISFKLPHKLMLRSLYYTLCTNGILLIGAIMSLSLSLCIYVCISLSFSYSTHTHTHTCILYIDTPLINKYIL